MVEMLLQAGANPTIADRHGNTCAHLAVLNKSESCLKILVKYLRPGQSNLDPFPELNYLNYDGKLFYFIISHLEHFSQHIHWSLNFVTRYCLNIVKADSIVAFSNDTLKERIICINEFTKKYSQIYCDFLCACFVTL